MSGNGPSCFTENVGVFFFLAFFVPFVIIDTIRRLITPSTPALAVISGQERLRGIVALVIETH